MEKQASERNDDTTIAEIDLIMNKFGAPLEDVYKLATSFYRGILVFFPVTHKMTSLVVIDSNTYEVQQCTMRHFLESLLRVIV